MMQPQRAFVSHRGASRAIVLIAAVSLCAPAHAQAPLRIESLSWLAGSWQGSDGPTDHEEHWTAPRGGSMVGMHRTVRQGRMVEFEFFRVEEQNGALVYLSQPGGRSPATPFTASAVDGQRVVFENPSHDFPQRIIYAREGETIRARIEGTVDSKGESMEWRWTRSTLAP